MSGDKHEMGRDFMTAALKVVSAAAINTVGIVSLQEWVMIAGLVYTVLMTAHLLWKWYHQWRDRKAMRRPVVVGRWPEDE
jgi:hypothetical protein